MRSPKPTSAAQFTLENRSLWHPFAAQNAQKHTAHLCKTPSRRDLAKTIPTLCQQVMHKLSTGHFHQSHFFNLLLHIFCTPLLLIFFLWVICVFCIGYCHAPA